MVKCFSEAKWTTCAVLSALLAGCAGASPFGSRPNDAFSTANGFDDPSRQPYSQLAQAFPQQNVVPPNSLAGAPPERSPSAGNQFLTSMQKMAGDFANAVTPTPQVIPAADPTSLSAPDHAVGADLNYHAARVYESQGKMHAALALYEKSLQMAPDQQAVLVAYARLLDREGNFGKAESLYHRAIELQPTNALALNDLGMMYARRGKVAEAGTQLNRAIQLKPMNQRYRNNMAIVLIDAGRSEEAFSHLAAVHGEANAHYNLGFLLSQRQMHAAAIHHVNQALTLNPQLEPARQLADQLTRAAPPSSPGGQRYQPVSTSPRNAANYRPDASFSAPSTRPLPPL